MNDDPNNVSEQARGWYRAAKHPLPHDYARFIALWEALCTWFRDVHQISNDRCVQEWLKDNLAGWHREALAALKYKARVESFKALSPFGIMRGTKRVGEVDISDESDFAQIARAIYTVRCNLMKGGKPASPQGRDGEVCKAASEVLDAIVFHLVFER